MTILATNNAAGTLASGITDSATSLTLSTGQGAKFPDLTTPGDVFYATIVDAGGTTREIVKVTAKTGDAFTIVRGADGPEDPIITTSYAFLTGARVELRFCKAMWDSLPHHDIANTFTALMTLDDVDVLGVAEITGAATLLSTLDVTGAATLLSTLSLTGAANLLAGLTVAGTATFNGSLLKGANKVDNFASTTTKMTFRSTAAPTGWTKDTTYNNAAFRVTSGAISQTTTAGKEFTTLLASRTLAQANLPNVSFSGSAASNGDHTHFVVATATSGSVVNSTTSIARNNTGGLADYNYQLCGHANAPTVALSSEDGAHTHTVSVSSGGSGTALDFAVNYVDLILATKD